jgi:uncharacterized protein (DUF1697 family)
MRYVGLVRNVMVGREGLHRDVLLSRLHAAGGRDGRSHLATGNVSFDADPSELDGIVARLEAGIAQVIGRREPVVVRTAAWVRGFAASDPFAGFPADQWQWAVAFLPLAAAALDTEELGHADGLQVVAVRPHELLTVVRRGQGGGPLNLLPPTARRRATSRSWSTVARLARLGPGEPG